jgi:hypothetical protein
MDVYIYTYTYIYVHIHIYIYTQYTHIYEDSIMKPTKYSLKRKRGGRGNKAVQ